MPFRTQGGGFLKTDCKKVAAPAGMLHNIFQKHAFWEKQFLNRRLPGIRNRDKSGATFIHF
jgi:hypothetical protein